MSRKNKLNELSEIQLSNNDAGIKKHKSVNYTKENENTLTFDDTSCTRIDPLVFPIKEEMDTDISEDLQSTGASRIEGSTTNNDNSEKSKDNVIYFVEPKEEVGIRDEYVDIVSDIEIKKEAIDDPMDSEEPYSTDFLSVDFKEALSSNEAHYEDHNSSIINQQDTSINTDAENGQSNIAEECSNLQTTSSKKKSRSGAGNTPIESQSKNKRWRKGITSKQLSECLDDIPTDSESEVDSNSDENEEGELNSNSSGVEDLLSSDDEGNQNKPNYSRQRDDSKETEYVPQWTKNVYDVKLPYFEEYCGPNLDVFEILESIEPIKIFNSFLDDDICEHIAVQTNLYATQKGLSYQPTNKLEIRLFIGINFLMAMKKQPSYRDYWSSDPFYNDSVISNVMSLRRFTWFLSNMHLNNNSYIRARNDPNFDRLYRVRPFLNYLKGKYILLYSPPEHQSIGQSMIKFKSRSSLNPYMRAKPIKRGYKVWLRADDNGYTSEFEIYTGKSGEAVEYRFRESVVSKLSEKIQGKGYKVYTDQFFSSVHLAKSLSEKGLGYCGTIHLNRHNLPDLLENEKLERGSFDWKMDEAGIACIKWMDTKAVHFISNFHNPSDEVPMPQKNKNGTTAMVLGPSMVSSYKAHIGGVGKADMLKSLYEVDRKFHKWWHRIFFHFLDVTVVNAHVIFQQISNEKMNLKDFKKCVIAGLIGSLGVNKQTESLHTPSINSIEGSKSKKKLSVSIEVRRDASKHLPELGETFRRCNHCSTKREPHRTKWICSLCNVPLCNSAKRNCFSSYHK